MGTTIGTTDKLKLDYSYGTMQNNGNVLNQTITVPTVGSSPGFIATQTYSYDSLNRLDDSSETVSGNQSWRQDFSYDRYGNRNFVEANTTTLPKNCGTAPNFTVCPADVPVVNPSVNSANNRLNGHTFDSSGNTTQDAQGRTFIYDAENKQVKVNDGAAIVGEYVYDGDGKRVKKIVPSSGEVTVFVYDAAGKLVAEYSTIVASANDAKVSYLTNDHLGSPRINTDQNGNLTARHDYNPFGEEIVTSQRTAGLGYTEDTVRKQFTGYERDIESELDFAQARMYNPMHGRFTAVDPLLASGMPGNPQTWNRYTYVLNNPLFWVDPTGLIWGKNDDNQVRWFDKKLGKGFSEFTPDAWQYQSGGRTVQLDANSSKWNFIDPVQVVAESNPIQELAQGVTQGVTDGVTGIAKGVGNSPAVALNGVTGCIFNCGVQGLYFGGSNPFEVPLIFPYNNEREASYGSASSTGTLLGLGVAGGTIFGGSSAASVVPETSAARFNPFVGKSPAQIEQMFLNKGFQPRGPDPVNGLGGYVNPRSGRSFHIDLGGQYKKGFEAPHVDVNRRTNFGTSSIPKRKFFF